ncbi:unnamed protein product [Oppiella nova]|uniref:Protein kinase domain-containing protein n=1 Tax=Oppiella nova TaxID=334625 RepID=A0A7R9QEF5_9ACAR|nr:unnamed protein product [Oppiella nova]CAG2163690.1 unnamed protein product [Oppiella nova]
MGSAWSKTDEGLDAQTAGVSAANIMPNPSQVIENVDNSVDTLVGELLGAPEDQFKLGAKIGRASFGEWRRGSRVKSGEEVVIKLEYIPNESQAAQHLEVEVECFRRLTKEADNYFGTPSENIIHLIDFGLAKEFIDQKTKDHIPVKKNKALVGPPRYMSRWTHLGYEQSRRDDLEAIGYVIMYFRKNGDLPWSGLPESSAQKKRDLIGEFKRSISIETLCYGYPEEFADYLRAIRCLDFEEKPNYSNLKKPFIELFQKNEYNDDGLYDWQHLFSQQYIN